MSTKEGKVKPGWEEKEATKPTVQHHKDAIVSVDWSTISGVIASLSVSGQFKIWRFNTVEPENVFMYKDSSQASKFKEAQRHLGVNPDDSIDTRDLKLIFEQQFEKNATKLRITRHSKYIVLLTNHIIHIVHGIYNSEGDQTSLNTDIQTFDLFKDIKQFYVDAKDEGKLYILRQNSEMHVIQDVEDINNADKISQIKLLIDGNASTSDPGSEDTKTEDTEDGDRKASVTLAAIDPVGNILAYATDNKELHLIDIDGVIPAQVLSLAAINVSICAMSWTEDGTYLVTGDTFGGIRFWKRTTSSMPRKNVEIQHIIPRALGNSGSYQNDTPSNLFSSQGMWNASADGNVENFTPEFVVFDFDRRVEIHKFGYQCHGDTTHDVNEFRVECSDYADQDDKWVSVGQWNGEAGNRTLQMFDMKTPKTARYWRWYIVNRHSKWQGWIWNARFEGAFEDKTANDKRVLCECFKNNSRHYSNVTFISCNGKLVLTGSTDKTANVWCVGTKENPEHPRFCSKIMLDAVIQSGTLNGRNMKVWNPGSNSILLACNLGTIFCFSITDILLNQKALLLKNEEIKKTLQAAVEPAIPRISDQELRETEVSQIQSLKNWIDIWESNEFVLESINAIISPIFLYLQNDKLRYISMLDSFVKSSSFGKLKGILSSLQPQAKGPIRKQPTKDLLKLYIISKDAHTHLQNFARNIVNKSHIHATYAGDPGLKKHLRCTQKTVLKNFARLGEDVLKQFDDEKQLNYENLCDIGRAGICCRNVDHMTLALKEIEAAVTKGEIEILRIKNRFTEARNEGTGYRDIQFNIRFLQPEKVPKVRIVSDSGHEGKNTSDAILTGTLYNFWSAKKNTPRGEWVVFDFGRIVECTRFDFAHYAAGCAVKTFTIETSDSIDVDKASWETVKCVDDDQNSLFRANVGSKEWQSFDFKPAAARYWRWSILSTDKAGVAVVWNVKFVYTLRSIANWSLYSGIVVELQLHDENFFQIRKEAMGHKNYTASRFLIDFIDTAVDKLTIKKHNTARDDVILMVQKLLRA
eukprot:172068_1